MGALPQAFSLFSRPRVAVAGTLRLSLGIPERRLVDALGEVIDVCAIDAPANPAGMLRLLRAGRRAIVEEGCESLHLFDARLTRPGLMLRRRYGVPGSVTLTAAHRAMPSVNRLNQLDAGFVHGDAPAAIDDRLRLPLTMAPAIAPSVPEPSARSLDAMVRRLRDVTPGRLSIALPWPTDREQVRWFRDAVAPLLHGNPVCVLLGAPGRREARLMSGAMGMNGSMRAQIGPLTIDVIAAAARCADVFVVPGDVRRAPHMGDLLLALIASKVPMVVGESVESGVVAHEMNALTVAPGDAMGLVATINKLLALPAVQRHHLGEEFARYTDCRWSAAAAADAYAERFGALVGRPQIPAELRAA